MEQVTVFPGIELFTNVWDNPTELIAELEAISEHPSSAVRWKRALTGSPEETSTKSQIRTNSNMALNSEWTHTKNESMNKAGEISKKTLEKIKMGQDIYLSSYPVELDPLDPYVIVLRYQTGQEYKMHADAGGGNRRVLSMVMYLNDDYVGGEIEFPHYGVNLKPPANSMIFFPSNYSYAHIAHPVKEGTKYAIVTWVTEKSKVDE